MSCAKKYLIIGHPRCGSGFAASCLSKLGISCSHESEPTKTQGLSSWAFVIKHKDGDDISPRYGLDGWDWRSKYSFAHTITHLRNPFNSFSAIINENNCDWSFNIRYNYIKQNLNIDIQGSNLEKAILTYIYWNKIALKNSEFHFRIEDQDDFKLLSNFLQSKGEKISDVNFDSLNPVNSKPCDKTNVNLEDYRAVSTPTLELLFNFCRQYKYDYIL